MTPTLVVIAGPNGAGKSTFTATQFFTMPILDPDAIARTVQGDGRKRLIKAGRLLHEIIEARIAVRDSFGLETTLSGQSVLSTLRRAKAAGMNLVLHYIGVDSLKLSKHRVQYRVTIGGHGIPEPDMDRRFMRSVRNLHVAARIVDQGFVYDKSSESGFRLIAEKFDDKWQVLDHTMPWLTDGLEAAPSPHASL